MLMVLLGFADSLDEHQAVPGLLQPDSDYHNRERVPDLAAYMDEEYYVCNVRTLTFQIHCCFFLVGVISVPSKGQLHQALYCLLPAPVDA